MNELALKILVPFVTALLGYFAKWLFDRHRLKREDAKLDKITDAQVITNIDAATKTWQKVVDALEEQVDKLLKQRQADSEQIDKLLAQRQADDRQIAALSKEVADFREQVETLQRKLAAQAYNEEKIERYEKLLDAHSIAY